MKADIACAVFAATILLSPLSTTASRAEVAELHMATQYGIGTLAMVLVQQKQLLEKHLAHNRPRSLGASFRRAIL